MTAALKELLEEIEALNEEDRLRLEQALARGLEKQWVKEAVKARKKARRRKIDQAAIDRAIERRRYRS